ncbi:MAG: OmpA family protein [Proteobacteria bacterium]|nr:OmpA family protein [Pseudomonadota bacterium]
MNRKKWIALAILLLLSLVVMGSCVSKKDYLLKVEEGEKVSRELAALRSEYARVQGMKEALDKQVFTLQGERNDLEKARTELKLKNLSLEREAARLKEDNAELEKILRAREDTLSKNIVSLRNQISDLEKENEGLQQRIDTLQAEAEALERQREEEVKEMKATYEDLLEGMKSEIEKGKITITQLKGKLKVNMLDEILFDSGRTTIKPEGIEVLERVGEILLNVKDRAINVEGHTDNVPIGPELAKRYPTNWELSAARATNVARYLQEKTGIDPTLLSATGYGEYYPVASNETEEGQAKNRRIEIVLVPTEIMPVSRE